MSENSTSQTQHEAMPDPLKIWLSGIDAWAQLTRDSVERLQPFCAHEDARDPAAFWTAGIDTWTQIVRDNIERFESLYGQLADLEKAAYQQTRKSARELGDRVSESASCVVELGREWRDIGIDAVRRGAQAFRSEV